MRNRESGEAVGTRESGVTWAPLLDICDFQGGAQPPKEEWVDDFREGYVRMLQIRDYSQGKEKFVQYVRDTKNLRKCAGDDLMLSRYGEIGQVFTGLEGAYNVALVKVIKKRPVDTQYLYYYFQSEYFKRSLLSSVGARAAVPGFRRSELEKTKIPLPRRGGQMPVRGIFGPADSRSASGPAGLRFLLHQDRLVCELYRVSPAGGRERGWRSGEAVRDL